MRTPNCKCIICGKDFYVRPGRLLNNKNHGFTCSKECGCKNRSLWFRGEGNHQFGLKEDLNASFKSWKRINRYGYVTVHKKDHPFCSKNGLVLEHRLIIEENADKLDSKFFIEIDGKKYLKKEYHVHHKNEIKNDNRFENLVVLTKQEHQSLHNSQKEIIRNRKGQIIASIKHNTPIPIKILIYEGGKMPLKMSSGAACFDCFSNENKIIPANDRAKVKLGFALELPYLFEALIRPRSGLSSKGIDVSLGTIDEDFRAEISAVVINNSGNSFEIKHGDRICQLAIRRFEKIEFEQVDELSDTVRGSGGFGSTGV